MIGVYTIHHSNTGLFYIGSTADYHRRQNEHVSRLKSNTHSNRKFQAAFDQDETITWSFNPTMSLEDARELEKTLIQQNFGNPLITNSIYAQPMIEETKRLISQSMTGYSHSEETLVKMSDSRKGVPKDKVWVDKIMEGVKKKVSIDEVVYESITEAGRQLGLSIQVVRYRINSDKMKYARWKMI